jgi:tetratricopeptide (TPR) repeat protein
MNVRGLALVAAACGAATPAWAHDGPPYPIVEERQAASYTVSVWTDPDATDDGSAGGQFWVIVHAAGGAPAPDGTRVTVAARPRRGGAEQIQAAAPAAREPSRHFGAVVMDHEGWWDVRVAVDGPLGSATVVSEVEATYDLRPPPGMLFLYMLPFVAIALLWLKAVLGRRRYGPVPRRTTGALAVALVVAAFASGCSSCRRELEVPEATYRETVTAFYTGLAAMQTSQEPVARQQFDRVTALVPAEPAGWANLGLLQMRQQDLDGAAGSLGKAGELAPESAAVHRLLALLESRKGRLDESIRHWKRAVSLDPDDIRARFALALETERQAGQDSAAQAQQELQALLDRHENLVARVELARVAAKRGDAAALERAIAPLAAVSQSWPEAQRERLRDLQAAAGDPAAAATRVAFLKNVLLALPEYRSERSAVSTPLAEIGEPVTRFLALRNPEPRPAAADEDLRFGVSPLPGASSGGAAVAVLWRNGDGPPVVVTADGKEVRLPDGPVGPFPGGTAGRAGGQGVAAADLNYDYRTDLVLAGPGGVRLLRQGEDGRFADVTPEARLPPGVMGAPAFGAWAADIDTEGDLDVVLAPSDGAPLVLRNNGDGTFAESRPFAGVERLRGFVWADLDGDGVPDAALLDGAGGVHVFLNLRGGVFARQTLPTAAPRAVALAAAEMSGDWLFDVLLLSDDGKVTRVGRAPDGRSWTVADVARFDAAPSGLTAGEARLLVGDLDNNAATDLVAAGPDASALLLGGPEGFKAAAAGLALGARLLGDLDGDGRLEVLGALAGGRAAQARSTGAKRYHWQVLRPRSATATGDQRINSFGVGGEVELRSGLHLQKRLIEGPFVHFGLGEATSADVVRILWPNGVLQSEFATAADAVLPASQRLKGSCPWLFAWNGKEMGFVTDLIWRSPLGLRINAQGTADVLMTEDWVKVSGAQLAPRDGAYDLRVTAELWETHFFDLLSLLVVDHPPDAEVWVDERFAIPPPAFAVIATGPVRPLLGARDDRGSDVSDVVKSRDGRHLDFAGRGPYQGITRDHFVEVEIPDEAPRKGPLWLLATGWVHPTDSSVNLAITQGDHAAPRSLSLHVADRAGRFREVRSGLGFPAGKNKTVLLDLTGVFPAGGRRRARLQTNLEVFWDRIGWAAGRPDLHLEPKRVSLASADLRPRGYSVTEQPDASSPEVPRYVLAGTTARWLDLEGYHTRFGEVRELLTGVDDRYVIMNAGDEIRLRFPAAPPPAAGMTRDFVLVGDGWVKDGDFNTGFSRTVLPLPTHAKAAYDVAPGRLEDDPVYERHHRDFEEYHTRYVTPEPVRGALAPPAAESKR